MNIEEAIKILDYKINMYKEDVFIGDLDKTNIEAIKKVVEEIESLKKDLDIQDAQIIEQNNKISSQSVEIERLNKEVEKYKKRCFKGLKLIRDNYGVLDKYGLDILDDILNGVDKE